MVRVEVTIPTSRQRLGGVGLEAVMNSIGNSLGKRKAGVAGEPANRIIRIPVRFSAKFITRSRGGAVIPTSNHPAGAEA